MPQDSGIPKASVTDSPAKLDPTVTHSKASVLDIRSLEPNSRRVERLPANFYDSFLSNLAKGRKPSPIRSLYPFEQQPNVISLLAGKPNPTTFPITNITVTATSPTNPTEDNTFEISGSLLSEGLQYGATSGLASLLDWINGLQERFHGRKQGEGWRVSIGAGSQDLIYKAVHVLVNPGDSVLVESPVYAGVIPIFDALKCEMHEVKTDANGILASSLRSILEKWPPSKPAPKVLYTVPYGCNPTGMTASTERRREVLALSRQFNFLILEDDPYFYLYYGKAARPPSYFALEVALEEVGRVIRFDSLSKILSSGIRIGFVSGPESVLRAIDMNTATANLQVSSLTQAITYAVLQSWGHDGFKTHTEAVSEFYRQKRDVFEGAMNRQLKGLVEWSTPEAGMFFWFKLLLNSPDHSNAVEEDSEALIRSKALEQGVLALPGTVFLPGGQKTAYVRASFSLLDEEDVEEALRRLRAVVLEARGG